MVTLPASDAFETTEHYKRLRQCYDAAFRELMVQAQRRQLLAAGAGPDYPADMERWANAVRYHRDRIADFLLRVETVDRTHSKVQEAAYFLWLNAGCPTGTSVSDWIAAQRQIVVAPRPTEFHHCD